MSSENSFRDVELDSDLLIGSSDTSNEVRPNQERAKLAQILIWIVMAVDIMAIISSYFQYNLLIALQNNQEVTDQMFESNDMREQAVGILYLVVYIVSIVIFIQWFRRAYYNLNARAKCNHTEGWAAGSWFVPIISLFRPYQIMREMWTKTTRLIQMKNPEYAESDTSTIGFWWFLWIVSNYIGNYGLKSYFNAETIDTFLNSTIADIVMAVLGIPLALTLVWIIKSYAIKEELLSDLEKEEIKA